MSQGPSVWWDGMAEAATRWWLTLLRHWTGFCLAGQGAGGLVEIPRRRDPCSGTATVLICIGMWLWPAGLRLDARRRSGEPPDTEERGRHHGTAA